MKKVVQITLVFFSAISFAQNVKTPLIEKAKEKTSIEVKTSLNAASLTKQNTLTQTSNSTLLSESRLTLTDSIRKTVLTEPRLDSVYVRKQRSSATKTPRGIKP